MERKEKTLYVFCDFYGKCANMKKKESDDPEPPSLNMSIVSGFEAVATVKDGLLGWRGWSIAIRGRKVIWLVSYLSVLEFPTLVTFT